MRLAWPATALVALALAACSGGDGAAPAVTPGASPTPTTRAQATPLPVKGRVTLYAADSGDYGTTLTAGDFNGDGDMDVVFAAAFADGPENQRPDGGEAYVFLGPFQPGESRDAAAGQQDLTVFGAQEGDQTGRGVAAGDLNGDGLDDIVIGAPFADAPGARVDAGSVAVIFGSPDLGRETRTVDLREGADLMVYGRAAEDLAGFTVATGELSGDSIDDLVVGAFWADGPDGSRANGGEVYVAHGAKERGGVLDLADGGQDVIVYGAAEGDQLSEGLAVGDVNGDGIDDLVLPATFASARSGADAAGRTYVIHSPAGPQIDLAKEEQDAVIYGIDEGDQLGHAAAAGDVDNDGTADILLAAVSADGKDNAADLSGEAVLVRGGELPPAIDVAAGEGDTLIYGADSEDRLGRSAAIGDVLAGGGAELLIGAPGGAGLGEASPLAGEVYVLKNPAPNSRIVQLPADALVLAGDDEGDSLASNVYGRPPLQTANIDGEGGDEILVSAPLGDGPDEGRQDCGEAYILFLATD